MTVSHRGKSTAATTAATTVSKEPTQVQEQVHAMNQPTLTKVPSLPIVGSLYPPHSGIPVEFKPDRVFDFWPAMRETYGDFYQMGMFGLGRGLKGEMYVIQDPQEMAALLRLEGEYPTGAAEFQWAFRRFFNERKIAAGGIVQHGPQWKRIRRFVQTDLLSPQSAARYVPGILEAVPYASQGAPYYSEQNKLNEYLNLASFDMFSNVLLASLPKVSAGPAVAASDDDRQFCHHVAAALRTGSALTQSGKEYFINEVLKLKSSAYQEFEHHWVQAQTYANTKIEAIFDKHVTNNMTDTEANSYANQAFVRQQSTENNADENKDMHITIEDAKGVIAGLLSAGVDTTGGLFSFKLLHLASSPQVQDKLYHLLQPTLDQNGKLTPQSLALPYLTQMLRESHRLANANVIVPIKYLPQDMPIHGHSLKKGDVVVLDTYSCGMRQEFFQDDIRDYIPERFDPAAVQQRKGTPAAVVDHSFMRGPFSQGARKCPGSRVANLEVYALMAQWVLDYEMELPSHLQSFWDVPYGLQTVTTSELPQIKFTPRQK